MTSFVTYLSSPPGPVSAIPDARARRTSSQANSNSSSSNDPAPASTGRRTSSTDVSQGPWTDILLASEIGLSTSIEGGSRLSKKLRGYSSSSKRTCQLPTVRVSSHRRGHPVRPLTVSNALLAVPRRPGVINTLRRYGINPRGPAVRLAE